MAAEIAEMPELVSKLDLSSCQQIDSEEDGVEIIIKPKRKDTVCSETSVSSCEEAADTDQGVASNKDDSDDNDNASENSSDAATDKFFDASDKLLLSAGGFDPSTRRDSGFSDENNKKKLSAKDSNASVGEKMTEEEEEEEDNFVVPDEELTKKIVDQVEFYFSDASITKDAFLLKHVRRNKEGFVSLKLISCFKRVKHLTKDWRQVAYAIKTTSKELEVNEAETKVRRKAPLPETDETTPSRTVVAYNLPTAVTVATPTAAGQQAPSVESVAEIFNKFGEIALVRILRPGNPIPGDVKQFLGKHPEIGNCVCALIEFEKTEYAKKAVTEMAQDQAENWRGVKVLELALKPKREKAPKKNKADERRRSETSQLSGSEREELEQLRRRHARRRGSRIDVLRRDSYTWGDSSGVSGSESDGSMLNLNGGMIPGMPPRRYSYVSSSSPSSAGSMSPGSPCCSPSHHRGGPAGACYCFARPRGNPFDFAPNGGAAVGPMLSPGMHHISPPVAPFYQHPHHQQQRGSFDDGRSWRSKQPAHQVYLAPAMVPGHHAPLSRRHSDAATGLTVPENVLRLPRGPDPGAGRGFRSSQFAQWTQPNRFQQKGRSGSVPTVVFTRYNVAAQQQLQQHHQHQQQYMLQQHAEMDMPIHAGMEQPMHMEQPQYVYRQPIQITQPPPEDVVAPQAAAPAPAPAAVEAAPVEVAQLPVVAEAPQVELVVAPPPETIPEIPAAEAAATAAEN